MGRTVLVAIVSVLTLVDPAFADPGHDVPDFGSAVPVPADSDYQITVDGHLIYQGDTVISCKDVMPDFITPREFYEEQARICAQAGFPPGKALPDTGGLPLLLAPLAVLLAAGLLARKIISGQAPTRRTSTCASKNKEGEAVWPHPTEPISNKKKLRADR